MHLRYAPGKEIELIEFVAEMNDLIEKGILRQASDFQLWLEDVHSECMYCFKELSDIVNVYIEYL
jgi:hypothetical protein